MRYKLKPSKNELYDWYKIQTSEDLLTWHQMYTPWLNLKNIEQVMNIYSEQIQSKK